MNGGTSTRFEHSRHATMVFLVEVSNAGGFKRWRAEKAREMMVTRALVARARSRGEFCATASLAHGLFNLRDDAIFLHVLGFCWYLNPGARVPCAHDYVLTRLRKEGKTPNEAAEIIKKMESQYKPGTFTVDAPTEIFQVANYALIDENPGA